MAVSQKRTGVLQPSLCTGSKQAIGVRTGGMLRHSITSSLKVLVVGRDREVSSKRKGRSSRPSFVLDFTSVLI